MVYKLASQYQQEGARAYEPKKAGRPKLELNPAFVEKVVDLRNSEDYGSLKIHFVLKSKGFSVSQHIIQRILNEKKLTEPCPKRRGQRKYVRYEWPLSNLMWHTDWSFYKGKWILAFIDDKSRRIMAAGEFNAATTKNTLFLLHQAILMNKVCPVILLSDKGTQFYNSYKNKKGERMLGEFEKAVANLGVDFWTSRRNHPQTNGKMEKWFDMLKKRWKKHPELTLEEIVIWYNEERIHHALEYSTPNEVYMANL